MKATPVVEEIRVELTRQHVTQVELARRLGVPRQWVARRLIGVVPLTVDELGRIAAALDVPVSTLTAAMDGKEVRS